MNTKRLEALARKMGVDCQIRAAEAQEDGRFFVFAVDGVPLRRPVSLGFTGDRAIHTLNAGTWERYALAGERTTLGSVPQRTGRSRKKPAQRRYASL
jgi:hypothetical protein